MKQLNLNSFGIETPTSILLKFYPIKLRQTTLSDFSKQCKHPFDLELLLQDRVKRMVYLEDNF